MNHLDTAIRLCGEVREVAGQKDHPAIVWAHALCGLDASDETPWCSSFVNLVCWLHRLPRSKSATARSWLLVGVSVDLFDPEPGDVVVLSRGGGDQPDATVVDAPGHVGFFVGWGGDDHVRLLGGNQMDAVSIALYDRARILGIRRVSS
jgi:uncharacterized protein (TIGR02594 family)